MENIFEAFEFSENNADKTLGRSNLKDNQISVWYNKKNNQYAVTIAYEIKEDFKCVMFGKIGDKVAMHFNDDNKGFKIMHNGAKGSKYSGRAECKDIVKLILGPLDKEKYREVFTVLKIGKGLFIINCDSTEK